MSELRLYVWRGDTVLKEYSSGLIVLVATSVEEAWAKLRRDHMRAYFKLQYDCGWVSTEVEAAMVVGDEDMPDRNWVVPEPEVFTLEDLPTLVKWGGE